MKNNKILKVFVMSLACFALAGLTSCHRQAYTYNITLNTNGGTGVSNFTVEWGDQIVLPTPSKEGYSFDQWYCDAALTTPFVAGTEAKEDVTYYANWIINSYTVTYNAEPGYFNDNGATSPTIEITQEYNSSVSVGLTPELMHHHFIGWYTDANKTIEFNGKVPASSITVYAKYEEDIFTVYFDSNGGTGRMNSFSFKYDSTNKILPENSFKYEGKTFLYWSTKEDGTGTIYPENADMTSAFKNGSITLYAQWINNEHTLTFMNENTALKQIKVRYDDNIPFDEVDDPTRNGEEFIGWGLFKLTTDTKLLESKHYYIKDGDSYVEDLKIDYDTIDVSKYYEIVVDPNLTKMVDSDLILRACFIKKQITITFDSNGGNAVDSISSYVGNVINAPENPTRLGYTFAGWCVSEENDNGIGNVYNFDKCPAENLTLYAKWSENTYNINFLNNTGSGTINPITNVLYTDEVILTKNTMTKVGYVFVGWNSKADGTGTSYNDEAKVSKLTDANGGNFNLYATWTPVNYTVKFDLNGCEADPINDIEAVYDVEFTLPAALNKAGYTFIGWNTKNDGTGINYSANTNVKNLIATADPITLYANFEGNLYNVIFNANNGSGSMESMTLRFGSEAKLTKNIFTRAGYTFVEWNTKADGSGTTYADEDTISNLSADGEDFVLYAIWEANTVDYKVVHHFENLNGTYTNEEETLSGKTDALTIASAKEEVGFVNDDFEQVIIKADGTSIVDIYYQRTLHNVEFVDSSNEQVVNTIENVKYGASVSLPDLNKDGYKYTLTLNDAPLTGSFTVDNNCLDNNKVVVKVIYVELADSGVIFANDDDFEEDIEDIEGTEVTIPANPTKIGYEFLGWSLESNGEVSEVYVAGYKFNLGVKPLTLYAIWAANTYTVKFDLNGNEGQAYEDINATYDVNITIPERKLTKVGFTFVGWNTKEDGTGDLYTSGSIVKNLTATNNAVVTLYAIFNEKTYTINFDANTGSGNMEAINSKYTNEVTLTANAFTKTGYTFKEWNTKADGSGTTYANEAIVKELAEDSITLYAIWNINIYSVKFDLNGAENAEQFDLIYTTYNADITLYSVELNKVGFTLTGWNSKEDGSGTHYDLGATVKNLTLVNNAEITLYAEWSINNYSIKFIVDGVEWDTITKEFNSLYKDEFDAIADPVKTGYTFEGWYFGDAHFIPDASSRIQAESITLNAKFEEKEFIYTYHFKLLDDSEQTISKTFKFDEKPVAPLEEIDNIVNGNAHEQIAIILGWRDDGFDTESSFVLIDQVINREENKDFYAVQQKFTFKVRYLDGANGNIIYVDNDSKRDINETYAKYMAYSYILTAFSEANAGNYDKVTVLALYFGTLLNPDALETANIDAAILAATNGAGLTAVPELQYFYAIKDQAMLSEFGTLATALQTYMALMQAGQEIAAQEAYAAASTAMNNIAGMIDIPSLQTYLAKYGVYYSEENIYDPSLYAYIEDLYNKSMAYSYILTALENAVAGNTLDLTKILVYYGARFGLTGSTYNVYQSLIASTDLSQFGISDNTGVPTCIASITDELYLQNIAAFTANVMTKMNLGQELGPDDFEATITYTRFEKERYSILYENYVKGGYNPFKDEKYAFDGFGITTYQKDGQTYKNFYAKWIKALDQVEGLIIRPTSKTSATISFDPVEGAYGYVITVKVNNVVIKDNEFTTLTSFTLDILNENDVVYVEVFAVSENYDEETGLDLSSDKPLGIAFNSFEDGNELTQTQINLSSKHTKLTYDFVYSTDVEVSDVLDYLYHGKDNKGYEVYYFYPEHTYNFTKHTSISVISGSEVVAIDGNAIKTTDKVGEFTFYFDGKFTETLKGFVLPYPEEITLGQDFLHYLTVAQHANDDNPNNDDYLNNVMTPYLIGVSTSNSKHRYLNNSAYLGNKNYYNGFKFDFEIVGRAGSKNVSIDSVLFGLEYEFYENGVKLNEQQMDNLFVYDETNDVFYFKAGSQNENIGKTFTVKVTYKHDNSTDKFINVNVPNYYKGKTDKEQALSEEFTFQLVEGLNVSTRLELRDAYEDGSTTSIILHKNIKAMFNPEGVYYVGPGCADWAIANLKGITSGDCDIKDYTAVVTTNSNYKFYSKCAKDKEVYAFIDVNGDKYEFKATGGDVGILDCEFIFNKNGKFKVNIADGNMTNCGIASCFVRNESTYSGNELSSYHDLKVSGNYFIIDGSELPYCQSDSSVAVAGVGNAEGYSVQNMHLFIFLATRYEGTTTFENMSIISNNIDYAQFVNDSRFAGMKENDYITITSGSTTAFMTGYTNANCVIDEANGVYTFPNCIDTSTVNTKMVFNNVNINNSLIGIFLDYRGSCETNYTSIQDTWANSVYGWGPISAVLNNSEIGTSGGAAIHIEDHDVSDKAILNPLLKVDDYTISHISNLLVGGEQWFVAYQMSTLAIGMKVQLNQQLAGAGYKVTNAKEEMNFIFLTKDENYKTDTQYLMDENIVTLIGNPVMVQAVTGTGLQELNPSDLATITAYQIGGAPIIYTTVEIVDGVPIIHNYLRFTQQITGLYLIAIVELYPVA